MLEIVALVPPLEIVVVDLVLVSGPRRSTSPRGEMPPPDLPLLRYLVESSCSRSTGTWLASLSFPFLLDEIIPLIPVLVRYGMYGVYGYLTIGSCQYSYNSKPTTRTSSVGIAIASDPPPMVSDE